VRTCILMNPKAGSAVQGAALRGAVAGRSDTIIRETRRPGEARELAAEMLRAGYELIVAAGGDGTINEVVNGLAAASAHATLGIIPLGTGNDLARTLAIPSDPLEALALLTRGPVRVIDLMKTESADATVYGINVASGGFSGQVDEVLTEELKVTWGPLAYLIGAARVLPDLTGYETTIAWEGGSPERVEALNVIVANGRTVGGGIPVAPSANPEDGQLDVVVVHYGSAVELVGVAARLLAGNYLTSERVFHRQVRRVRIASRPGMWFNVDGELLTNEPVTISVLPQTQRVVVGPTYAPNPTV
jgi:diacylglycerol kinase (ATP)